MKLFNKSTENDQKQQQKNSKDDYQKQKVFKSVKENIDYMKNIQNESWDLVTKDITLKNANQTIKIGLVYFAGLVDQPFLSHVVNDVITRNFFLTTEELDSGEKRVEYFKNVLLTSISADDASDYAKIFNLVLSGDMVLFVDDVEKAIIIGARKYQERGVEKPTTQNTVKGSHDSFNENLLTNVSLVRRRVKTPNMIVKNYILGKESNTNVAIVYVKGLADQKIIDEVTKRIEATEIENIIDSTNIKEFIKGNQFSLFPLIYDTERPDNVAANLFEGRVAIMVDASPFVLICPSLFVQFFHSTEDFFASGIVSSFFRVLRFIAFLLALYVPATYICLVLHHSELLPVNLLYSIAGQRIAVPFPSFLELIIIMLVFDLLRESGARMPSTIGSSLSFVGAIIIGQASVEAGLISSIVVIIAAISGITALIMPNYQMTLKITVIRYLITIAAVIWGFYGLVLAMVVLMIHLCSLRSFGVNYFSPFAPFSFSGQKDALVRFSLKNLSKRSRKRTDKYPH